MEPKEKVRENRIRRVLNRRGYMLKKSRRKDPRALDYGRYWIIHLRTNSVEAGVPDGMTLDEVEKWME